jgi:multisubunit Na+/H+ antiporter MnhG subunit
MKIACYVVAVIGLILLVGGVYEKFIHQSHHHTLALAALILGVVLLIGGLVASFVIKPKAAVAA